MDYDKKKHFELLTYSQRLETENKHIYDESKKDFFALQSYSIILIDHLHWENREHYFELIEGFLNGPIDFLPLRKKHRAINNAKEMLSAELILLEPNPKSEGFGDLIDDVISVFDEYCAKVGDEDELSDSDVKTIVEEIFKEIKDQFPLI